MERVMMAALKFWLLANAVNRACGKSGIVPSWRLGRSVRGRGGRGWGGRMMAETLEGRVLMTASPVGFDFYGELPTYSIDLPADYTYHQNSLTAADVDGDGWVDAIVTFSNRVWIRRNNHDGTLGDAQSYDVGTSPVCIIAADVNHDEALDLVMVDGSASDVTVMLNQTDGTFAAPVTYATGGAAYNVAALDLNGDGWLDLVTNNPGAQSVSVLLNKGDGTFADPVTTGVSLWNYCMMAADVTGDGAPDLVLANPNDHLVCVMANNKDGTFGAAATLSADIGSYYMTAADVNGDGWSDLISSSDGYNSRTWKISVLESNSDGTFGEVRNFSINSDAVWLQTADMNGDGRVDLITGGSNGITVLTNRSDGTFGDAVTYEVDNPIYAAVADMNGDGKPDVLAGQSWGTLMVLENNGEGGLPAPILTTTNMLGQRMAAADLDGDGRPELVVGGWTGSATVGPLDVLHNRGDGTFDATANYSPGTETYGIALADVDGDGATDIVTASATDQALYVLVNKGDGSFASARPYAMGKQVTAITAADLNGDGHVDLIATSYMSGSVLVLMNKGDGTFAAPWVYAGGKSPVAVAAVDVTGDGRPEIIVTNRDANTVTVLRNKGAGTFAKGVSYAAGSGPGAMGAADVNGDGWTDLVVANYSTNSVSVLLNDKIGGFATPLAHGVTGAPEVLDLADLNGDGWMDIICSVDSISVLVLQNNGDGTFGDPVSFATLNGSGGNGVTLAAADFNGDGKVDIARVEGYEKVAVFNNLGTRTVAADLVVDAVSVQEDMAAVEGTIHVTYTVRNAGRNAARGSWMDSISMPIGGTPEQFLHTGDLEPGQSYAKTVTLTVPQFDSFVIPGAYAVTVAADSVQSVLETNGANNSRASVPIVFTEKVIQGQFGMVGGVNRPMTFTDGDGTSVTLRLTGPGTGMLMHGDRGYEIVVKGTSTRSNLAITTAKPTAAGDDGLFDLASLTVGPVYGGEGATPIGAIVAATTNLSGALDIAGTISRLTLRDLGNQAHIDISPSYGAQTASRITLGAVDGASIQSQAPIAELKALNWAKSTSSNYATISAPSLGKLNITGDRKRQLTGALDTEVTLNGNWNGSSYSTPTLGSASIAGAVGGGWSVNGNVGPVTINGVTGAQTSSWYLSVSGSLGSLTAGDVANAQLTVRGAAGTIMAQRWTSGSINAVSLAALKITGAKGVAGDFGANLMVNGTAARSLGNIAIAGAVGGGQWNILGDLPQLKAQSIASGWNATVGGCIGLLNLTSAAGTSGLNVNAENIKKLTIAGNLADSTIRLSQGVSKTAALSAMTVKGAMIRSTVYSSGNIGTIKVGVLDASRILAGVRSDLAGRPAVTADFVLADGSLLPRIDTLTVTGSGGTSPAFNASVVAAGRIGAVTLPTAAGAVDQTGATEDFGLATRVGPVDKYKGPVSVGFFKSGLDAMVGD